MNLTNIQLPISQYKQLKSRNSLENVATLHSQII